MNKLLGLILQNLRQVNIHNTTKNELPDVLWELRVEQGEHVEQDQVLVVHILEDVPDTAVELFRAHSVARISMIWIFIVFFLQII